MSRRKRLYKSDDEQRRLRDLFEGIRQENSDAVSTESTTETKKPSDQAIDIGRDSMDTVLLESETETKELSDSVLEEYKHYKEYIGHAVLFDDDRKKTALEQAYERFIYWAETYEGSHPVFARNSLIYASNIAEKLASSKEDILKWVLVSYEKRKKSYELAVAHGYEKDYYILSFVANSSQRLFEISTDISEKLRWGEISFEERMTAGKKSEDDDNLKYAGHVLSFAGNVAEELSHLVKDSQTKIEWLKRAYDARIGASRYSESADNIPHAFHTYTFAANMARDIAELVESVDEKRLWYQRAFEGQSKAGHLSKEIKPSHSMCCLSFAAAHAQRVTDLSPDTKDKVLWAQRSYEHSILSVEVSERINRRHHMVALARVGDTAAELFDLVIEPEEKKGWGEKSYTHRLQSAELRSDNTPKAAAYTFGYTARIAQKMADIMEDKEEKVVWYGRAYEARKSAIELNQGFDNKHLAYSHGFAGDDALSLADLADDINGRISYLIEVYGHRRTSEGLAKSFNSKHAKACLWHANSVAKILGNTHPDLQERKRWLNVFFDGIKEFREYGRNR